MLSDRLIGQSVGGFATSARFMKTLIRKSVVTVLGTLWMPHCDASTTITLSPYDVEHARDDAGKITRDSVEQWLTTHSGDFSSVIDFNASIEDGEGTIDLPWSSEDNECRYLDTLPSED